MARIAALEPVRARFSEAVAAMSPRDRKLLVGLAVFLTVAVLTGAWWLANGAIDDARSRVAAREEALAQVQTLAAEHEDAAAQVVRIEEELRKHATQDLPSFMEKSAAKVGIAGNLQGVREKEVATQGTLEEKTYGVELSRVTLQQLTDFLYEIETSGYPLRVRSTKTKTSTYQGAKVLNVSMEVSAFRLVEDRAAAPAEGGEESP